MKRSRAVDTTQETNTEAAANTDTGLSRIFDTSSTNGSISDTDQRFRVLMLAHAMSVDARLAAIEAAIAPKPRNKGGRLRDHYPDFLADLDPVQIEATQRATERAVLDCSDIPLAHIEHVLLAFVHHFYDAQKPALLARAEARYRDTRGSANQKAALAKALQRRKP